MVIEQKDRIIYLRKAGLTYKEINSALDLNIPKSTLSYICKGVVLSKDQVERISKINKSNLNEARKLAIIKNKQIQNERISQYYRKNLALKKMLKSRNAKLIALAMLYLGEGAKWKSQRGLMLGSSDPMIIKIYICLLESCYNIKKDKIKYRIQHRADQDSNGLIEYWMDILRVPKENFYKCYIDKRTVGKKTKNSSYHGVCVASCAGTNVQLELEQIAGIINESLWGVSSVG